MGHEVSWNIGICHPVTSRPLIFPQQDAVLSPCNFAATHLIACILQCFLLSFATHEMEDPFATPQYFLVGFMSQQFHVSAPKRLYVLAKAARVPVGRGEHCIVTSH